MHFTKNISTPIWQLDQWSKYIPDTIKTVLDMTGNVGTEGIYFTKFHNITKVQINEIDKDTFKLLEENIQKLPKYRRNKIIAKNIDSTKNLKTHFDLILCDPPWGGSEYKQDKEDEFTEFRQKLYNKEKNVKNPLDTVELKLGDYTISELIPKLNFKMMAVKLPLNDKLSIYSNDFTPLKGYDIKCIPIKNDRQKQIKYVVLLIQKL